MNAPDEDTIDERLRAVFGQPVTPLAPLPGTWERLERDLTRRVRGRRLATGLVAAAVVLVGATAAFAVGLPSHDSTVTPAPSVPTVAPVPTGPTPVPTPPPSPTGTPSAEVSALPRGGPVPAGFTAMSASTTSGGYLYVLGDAPCAARPCTSLVRSRDGGATWVGVPAPRAELALDVDGASNVHAGSPDSVAEVRFATARDGWAFGGALWETHDGGATWRRVPGLGGRVLDVVAHGNDVYAVTSGCLTASTAGCTAPGRLLHARVSGGGFTAVRTLPGLTAAEFRSGTGAVVLTTFAGSDAGALVLRGTRWEQLAVPCPTSTPNRQVLVVTPPAGGDGLLALCARYGADGGVVWVTTFRSGDGGATWQKTGEPAEPFVGGGNSSTAVTPDRLLFATGSDRWGGAMYASDDGGRTWSTGTTPKPGKGWRWVAAAGGDRVLALPAIPDGRVYLSTDGGASFTPRTVR